MLVVVDEAYVEFVRDPTAVRGLDTYRDRPNVAVLRTFSKAYGLAGLRVGFAVAHPPVARGAAPDARCRSASRPSRRPRRSRRSPPRPPCSSGSTPSSTSAAAWRPRSPSRAGRCRRARPTSSGCASATGIGEFVAACEAVNLAVRRYADDGVRVTIGETEANDRFLTVAARFV